MDHCAIIGNQAGFGGGIFSSTGTGPTLVNCTISGNIAATLGDAMWANSGVSLVNCIIWDNGDQEIYGDPVIRYSDVLGGYAGMGNINLDPEFVSVPWDDYRLQWGSPCIDAGNPDPIYNDPDGTGADMGCYYYDQSVPVRVLLTPHGALIEIPPEGDSFDYTIWLTNIGPLVQTVSLWCDITLPDGSVVGPVLGPAVATIDSGLILSRDRTQIVPAGSPAGSYSYNTHAVTENGEESTDSFPFVKLGAGGSDWRSEWQNWGETFDLDEYSGEKTTALPKVFLLQGAFPNPFNSETTFRFELPVSARVTFDVFDIHGRHVGARSPRPYTPGIHQITFDASGLTSGVYLYHLEAGSFIASGKMVLIK